ncbi:FecR family protein [Chitinophaga sp. Cy-1792]|uniref:FecR family protein n=1 Tax=Chitinophaga sp. Cy-1792 TaxID=2608339 RepID=UPI001420011F|nr:FecR family protein [Chitinophaga sp. Cy-1792]NIG53692.1 FecR family protein [Chitinophaga sp. Cy-1792]
MPFKIDTCFSIPFLRNTGVLLLLGLAACHNPAQKENKQAGLAEFETPGSKYQTYSGETGARKYITLPDSSTVILNSASTLSVPDNYQQGHRRLLLDGDAWFEVKPDTAVFSVVTDKLTTEVLGTSFRVRSFTSQQGATVHLYTGKIKVSKSYHSSTDNQPEILETGQMILANKEIDLMEKETYKPEEARLWLADSLQLNGSANMMFWRTLEDWYGVDISVTGNGGGNSEVHELFVKATLQQVLDKLSKQLQFKYTITENKVTIKY